MKKMTEIWRKYHEGFPANGNPATNAKSIPMQIKSWLTEPSAPRISVGEICKSDTLSAQCSKTRRKLKKDTESKSTKVSTSDMYKGTKADDMPIPMPQSSRPIIIVCTLCAVALRKNKDRFYE